MLHTEDLREPEGPYPQFENAIVRWGLGPQTRLTFTNRDGGERVLRVRAMRLDIPVDKLRVKLNGRQIARVQMAGVAQWNDAEVRLSGPGMRAGEDEVELEYVLRDGRNVGADRGLLFSRIQVLRPTAARVQPTTAPATRAVAAAVR